MVNEIIREVMVCLNNGCCISGLTLALTLPDICGKALYPEMGDRKNKERYIRWFDKYIGQYEKDEESIKIGMPYLSGEVVYSLRCSLLHQGNPNIDNNKCGIIYFELLYRKDEGSSLLVNSAEGQIVKDENGNDRAVNTKLSINIRDLCWKICRLAEVCYFKNKEKFDFFNYNLVDTDRKTRTVFGLTNRNVIK